MELEPLVQLPEAEEDLRPIDLMERRYAGLHIILYWLRTTNSVYITLYDEHKGESSYIPVPNDKALDAFYHPYAYKR